MLPQADGKKTELIVLFKAHESEAAQALLADKELANVKETLYNEEVKEDEDVDVDEHNLFVNVGGLDLEELGCQAHGSRKKKHHLVITMGFLQTLFVPEKNKYSSSRHKA